MLFMVGSEEIFVDKIEEEEEEKSKQCKTRGRKRYWKILKILFLTIFNS